MNHRHEAFVERLLGPLRGRLPAEVCERVRYEATDYLLQMQVDFEEAGATEKEAHERAQAGFGNPDIVACKLLDVYLAGSRQGAWVERMGRSHAYAFVGVGQASLLATVAVIWRMYWTTGEAVPVGLGRLGVAHRLPDWVPLPDGSFFTVVLGSYVLAAPFVVGWSVGRLMPRHAPGSLALACLLAGGVSQLLALQLQQLPELVLLGLVQLVFWAPVSALIAMAVSYRPSRMALFSGNPTPVEPTKTP